MNNLSFNQTNIDLATSIRFTSAYVNSQNISHEFISDIQTQGRDLRYEDWQAEALEEFKGIIEEIISDTENLDLKTEVIAEQLRSYLGNCSMLSQPDLETCTEIILMIDQDEIFDSSVADNMMEQSGYWQYLNDWYENDNGEWLLEESDLEVEYNNDDNSITILRSRYVTLLGEASPCFPNGCFMSCTGRVRHIGYALEFDCFDDYSVKSLEDLPYSWIYDLVDDCFIFAGVSPDGNIESAIALTEDAIAALDLSLETLEQLKNCASAYRAANAKI